MLENFAFALSYRVKTNATFGVACFPSDKIYCFMIDINKKKKTEFNFRNVTD